METNKNTLLQKKQHVFLLILLFSLIATVASYFYFNYETQRIRAQSERELTSIAKLKIQQIEAWKNERLLDIKIFSQSPFFVNTITEEQDFKKDSKLKNDIINRFIIFNSDSTYENILLTDKQGNLIVAQNKNLNEVDKVTKSVIKQAVDEEKVKFSDLYFDKQQNKILIDFVAPIISKRGNVVAVTVFSLNPETYFFPLIESWPTESKTAETMLIERQGDSVLYVNDLRHKKNTALRFKISLNKSFMPSVQAALGKIGIVEGTGYNGKEVLAYISKVDDLPWRMIAQVDKSEIFEELYFKEKVITLFTLLVIIAFSLWLIFVYQKKQKYLFKELFNKQKQLSDYFQEFHTILYSIGDGVIITDIDGNIKTMNSTAETLTGWSEAESIGIPIEKVFKIINAESRKTVENPVYKVLQTGAKVGLANHTLLISKNGKEIPIADSGAPVRDQNGEIEGVVLVFSDKTFEYQSEKLVRESEARLKRAELASKFGNWELHLDTKTITASEGAQKIYGVEKNELDYEIVKTAPLSEYRPLLDKSLKDLIEKNIPYKVEFKIKTADTGEIKDIFSVAEYDKENKIIFGVVQDITERKKLERERVQLYTLVEKSFNEIYVFNADDLKFEYLNESALQNLGYSFEELMNLTPIDIKPEFTEDTFRKTIEPLINGLDEKIIFETLHKRKDGTTYPVEVNLQLHNFGDKRVFFAIINDITERKRNEEALRLSEERWQFALEGAEDGVWDWNPKTGDIYFSKQWKAMLGYDENEIPNKFEEWEKRVHPDDLDYVYDAINEHLNGKSPSYKTEFRFKCKDGSYKWILDRGKVFQRDKDGKPIRFIGTHTDIDYRKKMEEIIRENESFLNNLIETIPIPVFYKNIKGKYIGTNNAFVNFLGYKKEEIINKTVFDIYPQNLARKYFEKDNELFQNGITQIYETKFPSKNGILRDVILTKAAYRDAKNNIAGLIGVLYDITERKQADELLKKSEEKYRLLFMNNPAPMWIYDPETLKFLEVNELAVYHYGYSREEFLNMTLRDIRPSEDIPYLEEILSSHKGKLRKINLVRHKKKDNSLIYVEITSHSIDFEGKNAVFVLAMDVTKRKEAEEALIASEERFRTTLYSIGDAVIATDKYGKITQVNPVAEELTGYTEAEAINKPLEEIFKIINETTREIVENPVHKVLKEVRVIGLANHTLLISKNGKEIPIADSGAPIKDSNDNISGVVLVFRDQTQERAARNALEESEFKLKQSQRIARIGYYDLDVKSGIWKSSEMLDEIFGIDKNYDHSIEGWNNLVHPDYQSEMKQYFLDYVIKNKNPFDKEYKIINKALNKTYWVHGYGTLEFDDSGKPVRMFGTIQDITKRKEMEEIIQASEEKYRLLIENQSDLLVKVDSEGRFLFVSPSYCKMFGKSESELLGKKFVPLVHEDDQAATLEEMKKLNYPPHSCKIQQRARTKDGWRWLEWLDNAVIDDKGNIEYIIGVGRDITDRKKIELELKESEERYRKFFEEDLTGDFISTIDGKLLMCNPAYVKILGYDSVEEMMNVTTKTFYKNPEDRVKLIELIRERKKLENYEVNLLRKDGEEVNAIENIYGEFDLNGELALLKGYVFDITAIRRAEKALRESEERFHLMFENNKAVMLLIDPESGKILDANNAASEFYGYCLDRLRTMNINQINIASQNEIKNRLNEAASGAQSHFLYSHKLKSGEIRNVEAYSSRIILRGEVVLFSIIHDITERVKAENEVIESREKLRALAAKLEQIKEEEKISLARELHDNLGQRLTGLKLDTAWLLRRINNPNNDEKDKIISRIGEMSNLIDEIINNVRRISSELRPNILDYMGLLPSLEWLLQDFNKKTETHISFTSDVKEFNVDKQTSTAVFRIFQEAITNIVRHSKATFVEMKIEQDDKNYFVKLMDNGVGFPEEKINDLKSLGIIGMKERALQIKSVLEISNRKEGGTIVSLTIPKG